MKAIVVAKVTWLTFALGILASGWSPQMAQAQVADFCLDVFDVNRNGLIDGPEVRTALRRLSLLKSPTVSASRINNLPHEIRRIFLAAESDRQPGLSRSEVFAARHAIGAVISRKPVTQLNRSRSPSRFSPVPASSAARMSASSLHTRPTRNSSGMQSQSMAAPSSRTSRLAATGSQQSRASQSVSAGASRSNDQGQADLVAWQETVRQMRLQALLRLQGWSGADARASLNQARDRDARRRHDGDGSDRDGSEGRGARGHQHSDRDGDADDRPGSGGHSNENHADNDADGDDHHPSQGTAPLGGSGGVSSHGSGSDDHLGSDDGANSNHGTDADDGRLPNTNASGPGGGGSASPLLPPAIAIGGSHDNEHGGGHDDDDGRHGDDDDRHGDHDDDD